MDINRRDFLQIAFALGLIGSSSSTNLFAGEAGREKIKKLKFTDIVDFKDKGKVTILCFHKLLVVSENEFS